MVDDKPVRNASPTGAASTVDWDTSDLAGQSATLLIEDRSSTAGIVVDEIAVYWSPLVPLRLVSARGSAASG